MSTIATRMDGASAEPERHHNESQTDRGLGLRFGSTARCTGGFEGRLVKLTIDIDSCRLERIVIRTGRPAHDYVIPAALAERGSDMLEIRCTVPELTQYDDSSTLEVLPVTSVPRLYPPWQPLQQIREDLRNPFGRVLAGPRHLHLRPGKVELAQQQVVFGSEGILGTIEGVVTKDLETVGGLLVARTSGSRKVPVAVPIELIDDWETVAIAVTSRQLDSFD